MARLKQIELGDGTVIPVLYEDRSVIALDKPPGWLLAPDSWDRTGRNLHLALLSALHGGAPWANSRRLRFLRFVHRLDADTSGVLLFARSPEALRALSRLFATRGVRKSYLAVVEGVPSATHWTCELPLGPRPGRPARMKVDRERGQEATTRFEVLDAQTGRSLVRAEPITGRTHQIRVHLAASGHPVSGDALYGAVAREPGVAVPGLALRAWGLAYLDPFQRRPVQIRAPISDFCRAWGFPVPAEESATGRSRAAGDGRAPVDEAASGD